MIVALWKIFTKAGEPGWKSIIPIYNIIMLLKIVGRPVVVAPAACFIPLVNLVILVIVYERPLEVVRARASASRSG